MQPVLDFAVEEWGLEADHKQDWSDSMTANEIYLLYNTFNSSLSMSPLLHFSKHTKAGNCSLRIELHI